MRRRSSRPCGLASQRCRFHRGPRRPVGYSAPACGRRRAAPRPTSRTRRFMADKSSGTNTGQIVEIKGVVLDAVFPGKLPEINHALSIQVPEEGGSRELIAEVQQHLGDDRVRAVAMDTTDGLARGVDVGDTGGPISVPV